MERWFGMALVAALMAAPAAAQADEADEAIGHEALSLPKTALPAPAQRGVAGSFRGTRTNLDADKVVELVSARLKQVGKQALRELIAEMGEEFDIAPIRDLAETVPLLLSPGYDIEGRSRIIEKLAARLSAAAALGQLLLPAVAPDDPGTHKPIEWQAHQLYAWEAAYYGLARSSFADWLDFPEHTGQDMKVPDHYRALVDDVVVLVDTFGVFEAFWKTASAESLGSKTLRLVTDCEPDFTTWAKGTREAIAAARASGDQGDQKALADKAEASVNEIEALVGPLATQAAAKEPDLSGMKIPAVIQLATSVYYIKSQAWQPVPLKQLCQDAYTDVLAAIGEYPDRVDHTIGRFDAMAARMRANATRNAAAAEKAQEASDAEKGKDAEKAEAAAVARRRITAWRPWLLLVQRVLRDGLDRSAVRDLSTLVIAEIGRLDIDEALAAGLVAVFEELPLAVREHYDDKGEVERISLDVTTLADGLVRRFDWANRPGPYVRATVGAGYWSVLTGDETTGAVPAVYEELGFGWRWSAWSERLLWGPHLAASGLLHRLVLDDEVEDGVLVLAGLSVNLYSAIDLSVGGGWLAHARSDEQEDAWLVLGGLQIPLIDYLTATDEP